MHPIQLPIQVDLLLVVFGTELSLISEQNYNNFLVCPANAQSINNPWTIYEKTNTLLTTLINRVNIGGCKQLDVS